MSGVVDSVGGGGGSAEEMSGKAVEKRYEGLIMVRNKAVKGKGVWYWNHLEPLLVRNSETGLPKAVKLKCCLCDTVFSASNPSRTASEHFRRGTCPNFTTSPTPISSTASDHTQATPALTVVRQQQPQIQSQPVAVSVKVESRQQTPPLNHRKRNSLSSSTGGGGGSEIKMVNSNNNSSNNNISSSNNNNNNNTNRTSGGTSYVPPISVVDPSRFSMAEMGFTGSSALVVHQNSNYQHLTPPPGSTGGGGGVGRRTDGVSDAKMFEDSIKRLKSPKASPGPTLSKSQIECALEYLSDWVYESCGSVSFSSLEHPKFKSFLHQLGMTEVSKREFLQSRLDSRFEQIRNESDTRIRDAVFFQIASHGWKAKFDGFDECLVNVSANLPNGTSVYRRAVFTSGETSSKFAEEVLLETISDVCTSSVNQCVGIVSDKFKKSVLKNLESRYQWMINLMCQCHAFNSLIKDFYRELPLFKNVAASCIKLGNLVNYKTIRNCFLKYGVIGMFNFPVINQEISSFEPVYVMIEAIYSSARVFQLVLLDEQYKMVSMEDSIVREFGEMIRDAGFWNDLEAVRSVVRLVKEMTREFETERPLVGQCLPLWEELRTKVKDWCVKFNISEIIVDKLIEGRFRKNYHPAWAAAYVLDPFYMTRDTSGKYLPPFKYLSPEQQKDVHDLVSRLVSTDKVPVAMSELMRWRSDGLDPVYAQAVQLKQRDPNTGKMRIANPQGSRLVWETYLPEYESLGKVALRIIFLHATARRFKFNNSFLKWVQGNGRSRLAIDKAQKMIFIAAQSKLERRDFTSEDDKDAELFATVNETYGDAIVT